MKKLRVADVIVDFLIDRGVDTVFGLMGGGAMFLNDALALRSKEITTVFNHHEQASAMAAVGYSKMKNDLGAAMVTTGCGATNTITKLNEELLPYTGWDILSIISQYFKDKYYYWALGRLARQFALYLYLWSSEKKRDFEKYKTYTT